MTSYLRLESLVFPLVLSLAACGQSGTTSGSGGASSGAAGGPLGSGGGSTTLGTGGAGQGGGGAATTGGGGPGGTGQGGTTASTGGSGGGSTLFAPGTICNASGQARTPPGTLKHVVVILFENENFGSVNGNTNAPYMNSIAGDCGYATSFADNCFTDNLVSLPHYLALTSGSNCNTGLDHTGTGCITDDGDATSHKLSTTSIFDQVSSWRSYQESMPSACDTSSSGEYACKHNPAAYYSGLSSCSANDVSIAAVTCSASTKMSPCTTPSNAFATDIANDTLPAYSFVTPNLLNDMHDGTVTQADNWLLTYLPLVLQSTSYLNGETVVFVLWDEQTTSSFGGDTPNFFVSPYITKGTVSSTQMNLFAALRASESALGISTYLGCASGTKPGGGACPAGSTADVRSAIGF